VAEFRLFRTAAGWIVERDGRRFGLPQESTAGLTTREDLPAFLANSVGPLATIDDNAALEHLLPPIERQEVWAAGVTYLRSRTARMEETQVSAGSQFYDLVYNAERPELFFKAAAWRVVAPGQAVRIRRDATWNVPEPELALLISPAGRILGYTAGNDMSSRDIEGENPLYLPQAKVYDGSCALGPAIVVSADPPPATTAIGLDIRRRSHPVFTGSTTLAKMKRDVGTLVEYLYRETSFPDGCVLLTGTGIVPPDDFTLERGDEIAITIDGVGTLHNLVA
jgi:2-dehydro-3-deoxy-D-arabinonate dehydratase